MTLCNGKITNIVWCWFLSIAAATAKSWNIKLVPNLTGKTARTSLLWSKALAAWLYSGLNSRENLSYFEKFSQPSRIETPLSTIFVLSTRRTPRAMTWAPNSISTNQHFASTFSTQKWKLLRHRCKLSPLSPSRPPPPRELARRLQKSKSQVDVAELLNNFFTEIGPNLSRNVENVQTTYEEFLCATDKEFVFEETTSAHIFSLLWKLCKSKATGLDEQR